MNFILDHNGTEAVNLAFVRSFAIERIVYQDGTATETHVTAELDDDSEVPIKIFDSADADVNFSAAKTYLAELVDELNGGGNS